MSPAALALAGLLARPAAAQIPGEPVSFSTAPVVIAADATAGELARRSIEAIRPDERLLVLERLSKTRARRPQDLRLMLEAYNRGDGTTRRAIEASLSLLGPEDRELAQVFVGLLEMDEPEFQLFGILGAFQVRAEGALPLLKKLSSRPLSKEPTLDMPVKDAVAWRIGVQAAQAVALWEGDKGYDFLLSKARETPALAAPLARQFWAKALPQLIRWAEASDPASRERASRAWTADVPPELVRPTAARLRELVLDRSKKRETRHWAAVRLGAAASPEDVGRLLADRQSAKDELTRLLAATAIFASRDPRGVPLLEEIVRTSPDAGARAGALFQIGEMAPLEKRRELLRWVVDNDPDPDVRREAQRQLLAGDKKD